ncbi:MAG: undecaprenyldiphospho-muramoylpentapeptide beta-N-acetylglucosaminyltransferase [Eubacteriales bacterium]|nr:undecaprenyldiphospho-muramoylpentapeptide beta-N-acetylglucosaminyltransferase [Eubacteriales bacterium]
MRAIVTGGGSGGHIYPALAIADKIMEKEPDSEILYLGNRIGIEKDLVPGSGYRFEMVDARYFEKSIPSMMKTFRAVERGTRQSMKKIREFRPDVVIGTGGFVCVPVVRAAKKCGVRCFIQEQNAFPGLANRFLERYVNNIFLGFKAASPYFKHPEKHIFTGNPVRSRFFGVNREEARRKIGASGDEFVVFAFAGSQGADALNTIFYELAKKLSDVPNVRFIFDVGLLHYDMMIEQTKNDRFEFPDSIQFIKYITDMEDYLTGSDLVISRSGAVSLAETCVSGRASILIPSPNVTGNHQYYNAKSVADQGGAVLMEEKDVTVDKLFAEIVRLKRDPEKLHKMEEAAYNAEPRDAADHIYEVLKYGSR